MSYQRRKVLQALLRNGAEVIREGGGHTILRGPTGRQSSLGRHAQLNRITVRKIVKQLAMDPDTLLKEMQ
jgi:predicted RNA binding protein YcfA (HicA-like mRNA interferase family)